MLILGGSPNEPTELKKGSLSEDEERQAHLRACEDLEKTLLAKMDGQLQSREEELDFALRCLGLAR